MYRPISIEHGRECSDTRIQPQYANGRARLSGRFHNKAGFNSPSRTLTATPLSSASSLAQAATVDELLGVAGILQRKCNPCPDSGILITSFWSSNSTRCVYVSTQCTARTGHVSTKMIVNRRPDPFSLFHAVPMEPGGYEVTASSLQPKTEYKTSVIKNNPSAYVLLLCWLFVIRNTVKLLLS